MESLFNIFLSEGVWDVFEINTVFLFFFFRIKDQTKLIDRLLVPDKNHIAGLASTISSS